MFHPFLKVRARQQAAAEYADAHKIGFLKALRKVREIDDEEMDACCMQAAGVAGVELAAVPFASATAAGAVGAIGDGHIIKAIIDWLKTPQGQAFIKALISIILALLML
jgi:hypothetical protein